MDDILVSRTQIDIKRGILSKVLNIFEGLIYGGIFIPELLPNEEGDSIGLVRLCSIEMWELCKFEIGNVNKEWGRHQGCIINRGYTTVHVEPLE